MFVAISKAEKEIEEIENVFKALAHETRRHILIVLNARGGEMTAGEIAERFPCSWPTTTRHLRILNSAGLVEVEQRGREWCYRLNTNKLCRVVGNWLSWFKTK
jgi:ArsR family transcriptional regulator, arsenate/arsenite/antimonite-responsive transcriptional repressor